MLAWNGNDLCCRARWLCLAQNCKCNIYPPPTKELRSEGADRQTAIAANTPPRLFLGRACKEMTPSVEGIQSVRCWAPVPYLDIISFMLRPGPALPNPVLWSRSVRVVCFI
jgi:hypothetical protein